MRELIILRHGLAVDPAKAKMPDDDRPLTNKGVRRTRRVGRGLHRLKVEPDRILTSPLPRAWQTAGIVASALRRSDVVEVSDELRPGRDPARTLEWLRGRPEPRIMIVGHNPGLNNLIALLLLEDGDPAAVRLAELGKGGVASFRAEGDGPLALRWLATPGMLRRLGR
jgi:phosphohistidine phosphatase